MVMLKTRKTAKSQVKTLTPLLMQNLMLVKKNHMQLEVLMPAYLILEDLIYSNLLQASRAQV
jgi:hypothetical protein